MKTENTGRVAGRVAVILSETVGKDAKRKITAVIDCKADGDKYDRIVPVVGFGKGAVALAEIAEGDEVEMEVYLGGREWNGKFFSDILCKTVRVLAMAARAPADAAPVGKADNGLDAADDAAMPF